MAVPLEEFCLGICREQGLFSALLSLGGGGPQGDAGPGESATCMHSWPSLSSPHPNSCLHPLSLTQSFVSGREPEAGSGVFRVVMRGRQRRLSLSMLVFPLSTSSQSWLASPQPICQMFPGCLLCPRHCHSAECISEQNTAVLALVSSYPSSCSSDLHAQCLTCRHRKPGGWALGWGVPTAYHGGVGHSGDG